MALLDRIAHTFGYVPAASIPVLPKASPASVAEVAKSDEREAMAQNPMAAAYLAMNSQFGLRKPSKVTFQTLRRMSQANWVDRACIFTLRDEIGSIPWDIAPTDPKQPYDKKFQQYITQLLHKPNPNNENWRTFLDKVLEDILAIDAGCIEKIRNGKGLIVELWHVDGATIKPCFDEHGVVGDPAYQQFMPGAREQKPVAEWKNQDMIYIMWNPQGAVDNFGYGMSPVEAGLAVGTAFLYAEAYNLGFFKTNTIPPVVINMGKDVPQQEVEKFRAFLAAEMMGNEGFHTPVLGSFGDGFDIKTVLTNPKDMAWKEYVEWQMRWKVALYRMSPQDIAFALDQYKVEGQVQQQISQNKAINSLKGIMKNYIDTEILNDAAFMQYAQNLEFKWIDTESTDPLVQAQVDKIYISSGKVSINELRIRDGQEPIVGGQKPYIQAGSVLVPLDASPLETDENGVVIGKHVEKAFVANEGEIVSMKDAQSIEMWMDDRGVTQPLFVTDQTKTYGFTVKPSFLDEKRAQEPPEQIVAEMLRKLKVNTPEVKIMSYDEVLSYLPISAYTQWTKWINLEPPFDSQEWRQRWGTTRKAAYYIVTGYISGADLGNDQLQKDMYVHPEAYRNAVYDLAKVWVAERFFFLGDRKPGHYIITKQGNGYGVDYQFFQTKSSWKKTMGFLPKTLYLISDVLKEYFDDAIEKAIESFGTDDLKEVTEKAFKMQVPKKWENVEPIETAETDLAQGIQKKIWQWYTKAVRVQQGTTQAVRKARTFNQNDSYITSGKWVYQNGTKFGITHLRNEYPTLFSKERLPSSADLRLPPELYRPVFAFGEEEAAKILRPHLPNYTKAMSYLGETLQKRTNFLADILDQDMRETLDEVIVRGMNEGLTYGEIADMIQVAFGVDDDSPDMPGYRAERIARTESQWAINEGMRQRYIDAGILSVNVSIANTGCIKCVAIASGNPYDAGEAEDLLPVHPNCRCTLVGDYTELLQKNFEKGWITIGGRHVLIGEDGKATGQGHPAAAHAGGHSASGVPNTHNVSGVSFKRIDKLVSLESAPDKQRVEHYKQLMQNGHEVAPLLVNHEGGGTFSVHDGKHRLEAYRQMGATFVPTINAQMSADTQRAYDQATRNDHAAMEAYKQ